MELLAILAVFFIIGSIGFWRSIGILIGLAFFGAFIVVILSVASHA